MYRSVIATDACRSTFDSVNGSTPARVHAAGRVTCAVRAKSGTPHEFVHWGSLPRNLDLQSSLLAAQAISRRFLLVVGLRPAQHTNPRWGPRASTRDMVAASRRPGRNEPRHNAGEAGLRFWRRVAPSTAFTVLPRESADSTASAQGRPVYRPRKAEASPLWQLVASHAQTFFDVYDDRYTPRYGPFRAVIPRALESFQRCGMLAHGFARVRCPDCRHEYLLAFSCKQHGLCPSCTALQRQGLPLRFPARDAPPALPLPKPETGRYHLVRFIRSDRRLDVFGEQFLLPPEAQYAYVVATVEVTRQRLSVTPDGEVIIDLPYQLR